MSPDFLYNLINQGGDNGTLPVFAALVLADIGISSLEATPIVYNEFKQWPSEAAFREALRYRHSDKSLFWSLLDSDEKLENVKALLRAGHIVSAGIQSRGMVLTDNDTYVESAISDTPQLDHMVTIVGFDDEWTVGSSE
jgi:hypothetical protein